MGILDDAIREHLELKRQHGAESDDLERLEKEAFGAPARPGDPEFATGEEPSSPTAAEAPPTPSRPPPEDERPSRPPRRSTGGHGDWLAGGRDDRRAGGASRARPTEARERARRSRRHRRPPRSRDRRPSEQQPAAEARSTRRAPAPSEEQPSLEAPERAIFDADEFDFGDLDLDLDEEDDGTVGPQSAAPGGVAVSTPPAPRTPRASPFRRIRLTPRCTDRRASRRPSRPRRRRARRGR